MSPLAAVTSAYAFGTAAGLLWAHAPSAAIAAAAMMCVAAGLRSRAAAPMLGAFALAGLLAGGVSRDRAYSDCRMQFADGVPITVTGHFEAEPSDSTSTLFRASSIRAQGVSCAGAVRVRLPRAAEAAAGAPLVLTGVWRQADVARGARIRPERAGRVIAHDMQAAPDIAEARAGLDGLRGAAQRRLRALYGEQSPIAESLLLARTETLPQDVRERFAVSGLSHLLAISGTHVALVAGTLLLLARIARRSARTATIIASTGTVAYILFLGAPPAAARAGVQLLLLNAGRALQRPGDPFAALAAAALILLAVEPRNVFDAGFQLSFGGIAGITLWGEPLTKSLPVWMPRAVRKALALSVAASVTTIPIAAFHFHQVAHIGVIASVIAIPLCGLVVPALALALIAAAILPSAGAFLAPPGALLLRLLDRCAQWAAAVPYGHAAVSDAAIASLLIAAAIALLLRGHLRGAGTSTLRTAVIGLTAAVCAYFVGIESAALVRSRTVEIHAIDVGQGDALAVRTPHGRWLLIDAGMRSAGYDVGRTRVVPYLKRQGVSEIALLAMTHPHADHIGGVHAVLSAVRVQAMLDPSVPTASSLYLETLHAARLEPVRWIPGQAGTHITIDGVQIDVLFPQSRLDAPGGPNDYSLVFTLRYGAFVALFTGDAPEAAEERILAAAEGLLTVDLLKVGHHGSTTSTGTRLLAETRPRLALIPVGRNNRYGHPSPRVLERLAAFGVTVRRTDEHGAVVVKATREGRMHVQTAQ